MADNEKQKPNAPEFVKRDGIIADKEYVEWLHDLKQRYQQSQAKAAVRVNTAMLEFYWSLGHDIVQKRAESKWGSGFFNQLSQDMRDMFPNDKGFSVTNLKYMKRWYSFYYEQFEKCQQVADENRPQPGDEFGTANRPQLNFVDMGLHKGDALVYKPDENVTCSIIDQKHVLYKGEVTALSDCPVTRFARTASTAIYITP